MTRNKTIFAEQDHITMIAKKIISISVLHKRKNANKIISISVLLHQRKNHQDNSSVNTHWEWEEKKNHISVESPVVS